MARFLSVFSRFLFDVFWPVRRKSHEWDATKPRIERRRQRPETSRFFGDHLAIARAFASVPLKSIRNAS